MAGQVVCEIRSVLASFSAQDGAFNFFRANSGNTFDAGYKVCSPLKNYVKNKQWAKKGKSASGTLTEVTMINAFLFAFVKGTFFSLSVWLKQQFGQKADTCLRAEQFPRNATKYIRHRKNTSCCGKLTKTTFTQLLEGLESSEMFACETPESSGGKEAVEAGVMWLFRASLTCMERA